jgi:hypothetical protein
MQCPAELYVPSTRIDQGPPDFDYPFHDKAVTVTTCGRIGFNRQKINSQSLNCCRGWDLRLGSAQNTSARRSAPESVTV